MMENDFGNMLRRGEEILIPVIGATAGVVLIRALPIIVCLSGSDSPPAVRLVTGVAYAALAVLGAVFLRFDPVGTLFCYTYLLASAAFIYFLIRVYPVRWAIFGASMLGFLILPIGMSSRVRATTLLIGWELVLSVYSYLSDTGPAQRRIVEFLRFAFVDPSLVYQRRAKRVSDIGWNTQGFVRVISGSCAIGVSAVIPRLAEGVLPLQGWAAFPQIYLGQVGLASLQIGLIRQLGFVARERYIQPLSAVSAGDFWRRWNTYVGAWARIYIFVPIVTKLKAWNCPLWALRLVSVVGTFVGVGLLHELYSYVSWRRLAFGSVLWFCVNGMMVVFWNGSRARGGVGARVLGLRRVAVCLVAAFMGWLLRGDVGEWIRSLQA